MSENKYRCPACRVSFKTPNPLPINKGIRCAKCQAVFKLTADGGAELKTPALAETAVQPEPSMPAPAVEAALTEEPWTEPDAPAKKDRPGRRSERRDDRDPDRDRDAPRRRGKEPNRSKSGGSSMLLILVAVGVGGFVLVGGGCLLLSVLWMFAPASPMTSPIVKSGNNQVTLGLALGGRWATGTQGQQTIVEFIPEEGRFFILQPAGPFRHGTWQTLPNNEIELIFWVGSDETKVTTWQAEQQGDSLTLTDKEQSKVETYQRLVASQPIMKEQVEGIWSGDNDNAKGIELNMKPAGFQQMKDGNQRVGDWRIVGEVQLERVFADGRRPEYSRIRVTADTLELTFPDGTKQTYKRKVNP